MIKALPYGKYEYVLIFFGQKLATADDSEIVYFLDVDLEEADPKKHLIFHFFLNLRKMTESFSLTLKKIMPRTSRPVTKLICGSTGKVIFYTLWKYKLVR